MKMSKVAKFQGVFAFALAFILTITMTPLAVLAATTGVKVAGDTVFVVSSGAGGMSASQRAQVVQSNLDNALVASSDKTPSAVGISYVKGTPVVTLGGYHVVTVDATAARTAGTTPAKLAQRWADKMRQALSDQSSVASYVAHLSGDSGGSAYKKARIVYVPAGMVMPITLTTTITSQGARAGDVVEAKLSQDVNLGDNVIPAGSMVTGKVVDAKAGTRLAKSGMLSVKFDRLRTPDGSDSAIKAHLVGGVDKLRKVGDDAFKGETVSSKVKTTAIHSAIGAGTGALAGIAIGAIAGHSGKAVGRGAWSGAAIGAGLGAANALLIRKGKDVVLESGQELQLQLDAPATLAIRSGSGVL